MLYKDFIAQASIAFANKMFNHYISGFSLDDPKYFYQESVADEIIQDSIGMAKKLAKALDDDWLNAVRTTTFFDPADQPETAIANVLYSLDETLSKKLGK